MTTLGLSRRGTKRHARDSNHAKMVLDVDLNSPPVESRLPEGISNSVYPSASQGAGVSSNHQRSHHSGQHQGSSQPTNDNLNGPLIDLETIEDEVQMLSSSRGFPQRRKRSRRNQPMTVVIDEDTETNTRRSGNSVEEPLTTLSLSTHHKHERSYMNRTVINCEAYPDLEENNAKGKNVMTSKPGPVKEPAFTCPVCMNTLVEASSTICGHIFCRSCIKASIQAQKKCPTCRRKLTMNNFHRVYLPTTD